ncbi:MAG: chromosome segregation protein SMC [Rubrivivax sp.]|nr:MAG: chromosome segregation protein SMC [Rubrivivax sp.]
MYLSRIALTNVRSMASLAIDFGAGPDAPAGTNRRWTLLLGENGCGKSTVLRAIGLLLAGSEALPELLGDADAWIRNGMRQCRIAGTLVTAKGERREIALELHRGDGLRQIFERNAQTLEALDAAIRHADRNYFVLGYGVSRRPPETGQRASGPLDESARSSRSPRARALASMFSPDASLVSLQRWAMDLDYRRGEAALAPIRAALNQLMRGMNFSRIDKASGQLIFKTVDGEVPLNQLSDGYQNMAAWCGDLLFRITEAFPDRKDPLATRGVLLIDELDLHLHPVWRRQLVDFLSNLLPNFQFIATTHSALTAQQSGEGELFVIRREGAKQRPTLVPFVGEPRLMMLHQLLMSPMFGLESTDSVAVETARNTARKLHTKTRTQGKTLTSRERAQLQRSAEVLRVAPEWDAVPDYARQQTALLKELKATIAKQAAKSAPAKSPPPKAPVGKKPAAKVATKPVAATPALSPTKLKAAVKRVERSK